MSATPDSEINSRWQAELERFSIQVDASQLSAIQNYAQQLWAWNERLNLTRHTDLESFVTRDVVDSWQLAQLLDEGEEVLDLGTGGGVPGILVSILRPDVSVSLCESIGKKARAVDEIVQTLDLPIPVYASRAEEVLEDLRFDSICARAVGPLWKMCHWLEPHWMSFRRMLLIKGPRWVEERGEARHRGYLRTLQLRKLVEYPLPGTSSQSVILEVTRNGP